MMQAGLASTVRKCLQGGNPQSIDTADVDDAGWVVGFRGLLEQRCDELCEVENTVEIQGKNPGPSRGWVFIVGSTPV
jgi:hypothetical protein